MQFTENELVFFNSITNGGNVLHNVPISFQGGKDEIDATLESLVKKEILKSKTELAVDGIFPAKAFEDYKTADVHVAINQINISINKKDSTYIAKTKDGEYECGRLHRIEIMESLGRSYEHLNQKSNGFEAVEKNIKSTDLVNKMKACGENLIRVKRWEKADLNIDTAYFWDDNGTYKFDFLNCVYMEIDSVQIRHDLVDILQLEKELEENGR